MDIGLFLPQGEDADLRHDVTAVARAAEDAGYASLWVYERVLFPLNPADGMYRVPGLAWSPQYRFTADPLSVLTFAAAVTERARLGQCVLVAPFHHPHRLARTLATLDQLSGGRVIAGLGSGWSTDEFRACGADFDHRGRSLDEMIEACRALWSPNPVTYSDSRMSVDNALVTPKPVGRIPILLGGGNSTTSRRRIARVADGWLPAAQPVAQLGAAWRQIRDMAEEAGRDPDVLRMTPLVRPVITATDAGTDRMPFEGSIGQVLDDMAAFKEVGAAELILSLGVQSGEPTIQLAQQLMGSIAEAGLLK